MRPCRVRRAGAVSALALRMLVGGPAAAALQSPAADPGAPGPEHRRLDALVGVWDVTVELPGVAAEGAGDGATCEARWALDGRFLRQEYSSVFRGRPLTVIRYVGFDRNAGRFVEVQFESTRTDVLHAAGRLSRDGRTLTGFGTHVDPETGRETTVRTVTTFVAPDAFTLELTYADSAGGPGRSVVLTHRRKP